MSSQDWFGLPVPLGFAAAIAAPAGTSRAAPTTRPTAAVRTDFMRTSLEVAAEPSIRATRRNGSTARNPPPGGLVTRYLQVVVAYRGGRQRSDRVHPEVRLLEVPTPAVHLGLGDELVVLQHLDRPALWVEVDADRKMYPLPLRERAMGLDARAVFALIGNVVHVDPPAGIDVDRDDARPSVGCIGRQGRETHPLAGDRKSVV